MEVHKNGIIYFVTDKEVIVGGLEMYLPTIEIPSKISGKPVTRIANYAFTCSDILEVKLPETIVKIGEGAFQGCSQLMKVFVKSGNIKRQLTIEELAFAECNNLFEFWAENKSVKLYERCFWRCQNLHRLEFYIWWMNNEVFYDCNRLEYLSFDENPLFTAKSFDGANYLKIFFFIENAQIDDIESYILNKSIKIQCSVDSNLADLIYQGFCVEIY